MSYQDNTMAEYNVDDQWIAAASQVLTFDTHLNIKPLDSSTRLSSNVLAFLDSQGLTPEVVLNAPIVSPPPVDDSQPLTHYYVSTSHNTYLLARQILGRASPWCYTHALATGARCVEIDAWPNKDHTDVIVTHGHTFSTSVTFESVCVAIVDSINDDDWPVFVSLENHVPPSGQQRMVDVMQSTWGERLVRKQLEGIDDGTISPRDLKGRILLMVEYYPPSTQSLEEVVGDEEPESDEDCPSAEEAEAPGFLERLENELGFPFHRRRKPKKSEEASKISPELAALGFYARSMKPKKGWLLERLLDPKHLLVNISESAMLSLHKESDDTKKGLIEKGITNMRRVYPRGTRIQSSNLDPVKFWRDGSHFAALNWQTYDRHRQVNEAMFIGTGGWVLKDEFMRSSGSLLLDRGKWRITGQIVGISSLPQPKGTEPFHALVHAQLFHAASDQSWLSPPAPAKFESESDSAGVDIDWPETQTFEWECSADPLAFIRLTVIQSPSSPESGLLQALEQDLDLGDKHTRLAVFCARADHIQSGWHLIPLLDMKGKGTITGATMLVNIKVENI